MRGYLQDIVGETTKISDEQLSLGYNQESAELNLESPQQGET